MQAKGEAADCKESFQQANGQLAALKLEMEEAKVMHQALSEEHATSKADAEKRISFLSEELNSLVELHNQTKTEYEQVLVARGAMHV